MNLVIKYHMQMDSSVLKQQDVVFPTLKWFKIIFTVHWHHWQGEWHRCHWHRAPGTFDIGLVPVFVRGCQADNQSYVVQSLARWAHCVNGRNAVLPMNAMNCKNDFEGFGSLWGIQTKQCVRILTRRFKRLNLYIYTGIKKVLISLNKQLSLHHSNTLIWHVSRYVSSIFWIYLTYLSKK